MKLWKNISNLMLQRNKRLAWYCAIGALFGAGVVGGVVTAQQAYSDPQDRSTPKRTTDNADYDPQPYYVDGVQYKPYVPEKKKLPPKPAPVVAQSNTLKTTPATATELKPYVGPSSQPRQSDIAAQAPQTKTPQNQVPQTPSDLGSDEEQRSASNVPAQRIIQERNSTSSSADNKSIKKRPRYGSAIIQTLDKVTAETVRFEVPVGQSRRYKGLIYTVRACETSAEDESVKDVIAYISIRTNPTVTPNMVDPPKSKDIFNGWSFASSPALNPVQHPIYDAWVVGCRHIQS